MSRGVAICVVVGLPAIFLGCVVLVFEWEVVAIYMGTAIGIFGAVRLFATALKRLGEEP